MLWFLFCFLYLLIGIILTIVAERITNNSLEKEDMRFGFTMLWPFTILLIIFGTIIMGVDSFINYFSKKDNVEDTEDF